MDDSDAKGTDSNGVADPLNGAASMANDPADDKASAEVSGAVNGVLKAVPDDETAKAQAAQDRAATEAMALREQQRMSQEAQLRQMKAQQRMAVSVALLSGMCSREYGRTGKAVMVEDALLMADMLVDKVQKDLAASSGG